VDALTTEERENLAGMMHERKQRMRDEILAGLARMRTGGYEEQLSGTSDAGDEALTSLITDLTNAEVARDAAELPDIRCHRCQQIREATRAPGGRP